MSATDAGFSLSFHTTTEGEDKGGGEEEVEEEEGEGAGREKPAASDRTRGLNRILPGADIITTLLNRFHSKSQIDRLHTRKYQSLGFYTMEMCVFVDLTLPAIKSDTTSNFLPPLFC